MVSFLAKPGLERPRKSENKNYHFDNFLPEPPTENWKKNSKKNSKNKKTPRSLLFNPKQVRKGRERVTIKIIVPIISYPTCYREFQKIVKKRKKKEKKYHYGFFSSKNRLGKAENEWK